MSTITREFTKEQLQQIEAAAKEVMWPVVWSEKKAREHFSEKITPKVVLKLARIALALLEAEDKLSSLVASQESLGGDFEKILAENIEELYVPSKSTTPATVSVPDEVSWEDVPEEITEDDMALASAWAHGFNQCRAVMLHGTEPVKTAYKLPGDFESFISWLTSGDGIPDWLINGDKLDDEKVSFLLKVYRAGGNSPVIQDGWVACSDRMPEDEQEVLTRNKMGHCFVSFFDEHSGLFFDRIDVAAACCIEHILVTHWMPMPAAPQQEVNP